MNPKNSLQLTEFPIVLILGACDSVLGIVPELAQKGCSILRASDPHEALVVVRTHSRSIDLLLTETCCDTGFINELRQYLPKLRVLVLPKPADPLAVLAEVHQHLEKLQTGQGTNFGKVARQMPGQKAATAAAVD
jgi:hypothetical protein